MSNTNPKSLDHIILDNFGGLLTNSLSTLVEDDMSEEEPLLLVHSPYMDNKMLIDTMKCKTGVFKCVSLNIQSLNAKIDLLRIFSEQLLAQGCPFEMIFLQETWINIEQDISMFEIDGYDFISQPFTVSSHGGLGIYIKKDITYNIMNLNPSPSNTWEGQFIQVKCQNKIANFGNIYRPPRELVENYTTFTNELDAIISTLQGETIFAGDLNIDLLKIKEKPHINDFFESLLSAGFIPKIMLPTRFSRNSGTLIDNFFCKISQNFSQTTSGILTHKISDHQPYFVCLDYFTLPKSPPKFITVMIQSDQAIEALKTFLTSQNIIDKLDKGEHADPNSNYDILSDILATGIQTYLPKRIVKLNKHKHKKTKWVTRAIINSIAFRDKLYLRLKKTPSDSTLYDQLKINLNTYNNILKKTIRAAKKMYYHNQFDKFKSDIKNTWVTIKGIINQNRNKNKANHVFTINNNDVSDKAIICNEFNHFFTNIGSPTATGLSNPNNLNFRQYLSASNTTFQFRA